MIYFLAFLGVSLSASLSVIGKKVLTSGVDGFTYIGITTAILSVLAFFGSALSFGGKINLSGVTNVSMGWMLVMAIINFIAFYIYTIVIKDMAVTQYEIISIVTPIIAAFLAYFLLNEAILFKHILGATIVGAGLYVALHKS